MNFINVFNPPSRIYHVSTTCTEEIMKTSGSWHQDFYGPAEKKRQYGVTQAFLPTSLQKTQVMTAALTIWEVLEIPCPVLRKA
jgi:hypothetical protein